jgi:hypothetical protein
MSYNSSYLQTNSVTFSSITGEKSGNTHLQANTQCTGGDVSVFTLSESSWYTPIITSSVTSNILTQQRQRNGTKNLRRRFVQCEQFRLIPHEIILLNGDIPRQNWNVTYSVNRPLLYCLLSYYMKKKTYDAVAHQMVFTSPSETSKHSK